ncbi:hypothetical protein MYX76_15595 [Desulfobacterota bacterium AH_259_B03_O07]|nr:hypothetical protein [Desulfobacterota bacterium AH_259_B03_O07]
MISVSVIVFLLFVIILLGSLIWIGYRISASRNDKDLSRASSWVHFLQLVVIFLATSAAVLGTWYTFFTPFSPLVTVGSYTWRIRPEGSPNMPVELVLWIYIENQGARSGVVRDLIAVVSFPKGDWLLTPIFFVESKPYLEALMKPQDAPGVAAEALFIPIAVAGYQHVSKGILFAPFEGHADRSLIEPGVHMIHFYAHYGNDTVSEIAKRKIVIEEDFLELLQQGKTIAGMQFQRSMPSQELLDAAGFPRPRIPTAPKAKTNNLSFEESTVDR